MESQAGATATQDADARQAVESYGTYPEAQRAVDTLSDAGFPVDSAEIVGQDLRLVERVTGRVTNLTATGAGAATGAWFGCSSGCWSGCLPLARSGSAWSSGVC